MKRHVYGLGSNDSDDTFHTYLSNDSDEIYCVLESQTKLFVMND